MHAIRLIVFAENIVFFFITLSTLRENNQKILVSDGQHCLYIIVDLLPIDCVIDQLMICTDATTLTRARGTDLLPVTSKTMTSLTCSWHNNDVVREAAPSVEWG